MSYLDFSQRWDFHTFERFLQGYHEPKHGLGLIGNEHMDNYHFCPQDGPGLGFDLKLPGGGVKSFSAKSYRALAKMITEDKDAMMASVGVIPGSLRYASKELRDDIDLVMKAVQKDPFVIDFASKRLQGEKAVVLEAVRREGFVLNYVSNRFEDDKDVMMAAVSENGYMLRHASKRLKDDVELVRLAVNHYPDAIRHASDRIRSNTSLLSDNQDKKSFIALDDQIAVANSVKVIGKKEEVRTMELPNNVVIR